MEISNFNDGVNIQVVIIKGPGAVGKTEIIKKLVQGGSRPFQKVIRHTTRVKGFAEVDGADYHFISETGFLRMIRDSGFIEHKRYTPGYYGTSFTALTEVLSNNRVALLDVDPGAATIIEDYLTVERIRHKSFYIVPIALNEFQSQNGVETAGEVLERRMIGRNRLSDNGVWGAFERKREAIEWFRKIKKGELLIPNINGYLDSTIKALLEQIN